MLLQGWIGRWSPGIGDPSVMGWITVLAYIFAAGWCWRARGVAVREVRAGAVHRSALFWALGAAGLVLLGINKQLDLQSAVTELGRIVAHQQGWYDQRREVQVGFIAAVLLVAAVGCGVLVYAARGDLRRIGLALFGAVELSAFVALRASSFHGMDRFIGLRLGGVVAMNWVMELGGIACIAVAAWRFRTPAHSA